jgi:protein-glutamine gamma-glutamyltransferase
MYLERLLQINMATLAALGALLLGMGQRSVGPPLLVMFAAALSVWLTDVTGKFRIGRWTANILMLVGAFVSLRDVYPPRTETQTIGLSWFLIYLQIILLFQEKDQWKFWLLIMLSLLEVVVATLFSQGAGFGVLLVIYMLLGFFAMTLLMLYRQWELFRSGKSMSGGADGLWLAIGALFKRPSRLAVESSGNSAALRTAPASRWPLLGERPEFTSLPGGANNAGIGRDLAKRLGRMGLLTMGLTFIMFFALPRVGQVTSWRNPTVPSPQTQSLVGFTDTVKLGELGSIVESRETVLKIQFFEGRNSTTPMQLNGSVYLQGAYLMTYKNGQWAGSVIASTNPAGTTLLLRERWLPWNDIVRQKVKMEGLDRGELFYVAPYLAIDKDFTEIQLDPGSQRLLRPEHQRSREFSYTLATTAIVKGTQLPLMPAGRDDNPNILWELPKEDLSGLIKQAAAWIKESGITADDRIGRARWLCNKLASGEFRYSLGGVERNPKIDPIEDFVTEHRQGHCEYFATALTLMLRSQGIPARMVSGFMLDGTDWNSAGGYYQVRQLHAHTWVEVLLRSSQLPDNLKHATGYWSGANIERSWNYGGWMRLDPTPAGSTSQRETWLTPLRDGYEWMEGAWSRYVVEFDSKTQQDSIYHPIVAVAREFWKIVVGLSLWQIFDSANSALYLDHLSREVRWTLLGIVAVMALAGVAGIGWWLFRIARRIRARWTGRQQRRRGHRRANIAFYRRFESLMARHGLVRAPAQTQREFAAAVGDHLASLTGENRLASLPAVVADAFYWVHFGHAPLDNLQTQAVEQALVEIAGIRKNKASRKPRPSGAGA